MRVSPLSKSLPREETHTSLLLGIQITKPEFWINEEECTDALLRHVFRSASEEEIPLLDERLQCLREAGRVLCSVGRCPWRICLPFEINVVRL
jgi:hypothetical protein